MMVMHSNDLSHSPHLGSDNQGLSGDGLHMIKTSRLEIVLPTYAKDKTEIMHMKFL